MEPSRDKGVFIYQSRVGSKLHGDEEEQATLGSYLYTDEGQRLQSKRRTVQVQVEESRHSIQEAARQQFPFYDDLQAIFTARMQSILCSESEGGGGGGATRKMSAASDEEEDTEENELDDKYSVRKKKKVKIGGTGTSGGNNDIKQILEDFMRQQLQMEMQWREAFESRENERRSKEIEWRQTMEALENERMMMERRWREREEQRRMREEARAEKRDALITTLLNKLRREGQM
ncbi:trihelix transcription factor GT-3b-like isoform X3 [Hibiscus syriacus]|uniref:trihelix transcription factor GT-3b-like isoform X3 n=1 Tax=Hibiscus syriacus TaxID=106335 RepID=UPI0019235558|nr:trihelix transcription factor GT-3b-like isoform X3 [Hibiscus syriacus]